MTLPAYAVTFRGHPACPCQATWLPAFEAEAQRRGILKGPLPLSQLIGGATTSAGTHSQGGADDTYPLTGIDVTAYVALSRDMGADATWHRPYNWDGKGGVSHVHRVLTGCPHNGPAAYQITAVRDGFNGLGHLGRGGPDTGPRPLSGRTWQQGITWAQHQEDDMTPEEMLDATVKTAGDRHLGVVLGQTWRTVLALQAQVTGLTTAVTQLAAGTQDPAAIGAAVEDAVRKALADSTVDVDVTVHDKTGA